MSRNATSARFELLVNKVVDGLDSAEERAELDAWLAEHPARAAELDDLVAIKQSTDAMTARILQDACIEPPRHRPAARAVLNLSFALLLFGELLLLGFAAYAFTNDSAVPLVVKIGAAAAALGAIGLLGYVLRVRARAAGRDPYREIDL